MSRGDRKKIRDYGRELVFERVVPPPFHKHPYFFWVFVCLLLLGVSIGFAWPLANPRAYLGLCIPLALGVLAVPLAFKVCHWRLIEWAKHLDAFTTDKDGQAKDRFLQELSFLKGTAAMTVAGLATGTLAVFAYDQGGYVASNIGLAGAFAYVVIFVSASLAGVGIMAIYRGGQAFWRLGVFEIRVERHKFGVLSTGIVLVQCYLVIGVTWGFYVSSAVFSMPGEEVLEILMGPPMLLLAAPTLALFLGTFVFCQVPLHKRMVDFKRARLLNTEDILRTLRPESAKELNEETRKKIEYYETQKAQIIALPEWPFNFKSFLGAVASSAMVFMPLPVKLVFGTLSTYLLDSPS